MSGESSTLRYTRKLTLMRNGSANATTLINGAKHALEMVRNNTNLSMTKKPILAIMTVEPGVLQLFEQDSLAKDFDVRLLPPSILANMGRPDEGSFDRRKIFLSYYT